MQITAAYKIHESKEGFSNVTPQGFFFVADYVVASGRLLYPIRAQRICIIVWLVAKVSNRFVVQFWNSISCNGSAGSGES